MRSWLSSPRRRRRLLWIGASLGLIGSVVAVGVLYPSTAKDPKETRRNEPIKVFREPKPVRLTRSDRALALRTALNFVNTAVARRRVEDSWALAAPQLRQGMSRAEWGKGEIPVEPFPAVEARVAVDYSYRNQLGLRMLLVPAANSSLNAMTFNMDLTAFGSGAKRRWLVNSWAPTAVGAGAVAPASSEGGGVLGGGSFGGGRIGGGSVGGGGAPNPEGLNAPLGAGWILLPLGVLSLVLLIPIGLGVRSWLEGRRALRAYEASRRV